MKIINYFIVVDENHICLNKMHYQNCLPSTGNDPAHGVCVSEDLWIYIWGWSQQIVHLTSIDNCLSVLSLANGGVTCTWTKLVFNLLLLFYSNCPYKFLLLSFSPCAPLTEWLQRCRQHLHCNHLRTSFYSHFLSELGTSGIFSFFSLIKNDFLHFLSS